MTKNPVKILILDKYNPISGALKNLISEMGSIIQLTEEQIFADIIVSFAYHDEDDIMEMKTLSNMTREFPAKKIVFLSWFHPLDDYDKYRHLFNPGNPACVLMDANRYRILQLPVTKEMLIGNILELTKFV
jgi:hypothetical protein